MSLEGTGEQIALGPEWACWATPLSGDYVFVDCLDQLLYLHIVILGDQNPDSHRWRQVVGREDFRSRISGLQKRKSCAFRWTLFSTPLDIARIFVANEETSLSSTVVAKRNMAGLSFARLILPYMPKPVSCLKQCLGLHVLRDRPKGLKYLLMYERVNVPTRL